MMRPATMTTKVADPDNTRGPRVSVVMIFLNEEDYIEEAIRSVLAQTFSAWELLLVDDGSTDGSSVTARSYAAMSPDRIRYLTHPGGRNRGMGASRNLGLRQARGEFVAFLDADDVYLPQCLELQVAALDEHPEVALVYGETEYWHSWNPEQDPREDWVWRHFGVPAGFVVEPPRMLANYLRDGGTLPCMNLVARRSVVDSVGGFEDEFRGLFEDQVFLAKIAAEHALLPLDHLVARYRQHAESICATSPVDDVRVAHLRYLEWLHGYLLRIGFADGEVLRLLRRELWSRRHPRVQAALTWPIRTAHATRRRFGRTLNGLRTAQ